MFTLSVFVEVDFFGFASANFVVDLGFGLLTSEGQLECKNFALELQPIVKAIRQLPSSSHACFFNDTGTSLDRGDG